MRKRSGLYWSRARDSDQGIIAQAAAERLVPKPQIPEGTTKAEVRALMKQWLIDLNREAQARVAKRADEIRQQAEAAEKQKTRLRPPPPRRMKIDVKVG